MVVVIRIEVTDEQRRAARNACGENGLATRKEIAAIAANSLRDVLDGYVSDMKDDGLVWIP